VPQNPLPPGPSRAELLALLGPAASELPATHVPRGRRIFTNRSLRMDGIDVVGFDMDYTLALYVQPALESLSIQCTLDKLIANRGYPDSIRGLRFDPLVGVRGIVVDRRLGNLLKMDRYGHVGRALHGHQRLPKERRIELYRSAHRIRLSSPRYAWVDTLFSLPEASMYAALVDHLEPQGRISYAKLWTDIRESIDEAHRDESMKRVIKADVGRYIERDPELGATLHKLRSSGKRLFVLTNSLWDYTDALMRYLLDGQLAAYPSWRSYFDAVIVGAAKPGFFTDRRAMVELDPRGAPDAAVISTNVTALARGRIYQGGNLHEFEALLGTGGDRVLYIGDHIYGDMLRSKKSSNWRTAMIIQELEHELATHDQMRDRIAVLEELELRLPRLDSEINYQQLVLRMLQKVGDGPAPVGVERARRAVRAHLETLREQLRIALDEHRVLRREIDAAFNPFWGQIFREGNENSRFGEQVEDYACVYTSRVSNFLAYSPLQYFRSPRDHMPHELD
jgi:5'-nucleotidase